jgi:hypothetical protein
MEDTENEKQNKRNTKCSKFKSILFNIWPIFALLGIGGVVTGGIMFASIFAIGSSVLSMSLASLFTLIGASSCTLSVFGLCCEKKDRDSEAPLDGKSAIYMGAQYTSR